ncbi:MAG: DUF6445 family protein [Pseudomonadota bacterium]|nr:DUF6445 family protein [Pseudomonadota bacterium]
MNRDDASRLFNPTPAISTVPLPRGHQVVVIDDILLDPGALVAWASEQAFQPPTGFPYPGLVTGGPPDLSDEFADHFARHVRARLRASRTLAHDVRLSLVTTPPARLDPRQWQCHRDRVSTDPATLYVASVLYLFRDPALGGTSFYVPRQSPGATERIQYDSQTLGAEAFGARYGLTAGYMDGSNAYFECVARVPAAWNRMILYDAGFFHSGDIGRPDLLTTDPATGRLTLNCFFGCRREGD